MSMVLAQVLCAVEAIMRRARALFAAALDVVAPPSCPGCDAPSASLDSLLCADCCAELAILPRDLPVTAPLAFGLALGPYDSPLGALIRRGKYRPDPRAIDELADRLARASQGRLPAADAVVPVPVPARRRLSRGFNQAEILAAAVAHSQGLPLVHALRRVRASEQAGRSGRARAAGARGSFRAVGPVPTRVILVDDVCTTGATAAACADELLCAGASWLGLVCVAAAAL